MADVRPFRALRYAPGIDLSSAICPPFDIISPQEQRALHDRSPCNAVHIELAEDQNGDRYQNAAETLARWRRDGAALRDEAPSFYLYRQAFAHDGRTHTRTILFARLRLEPWEERIVLPHEQTFGGPKEDRLKLLRATRLNASPVFLIYRDEMGSIAGLLRTATSQPPSADFATADGQSHTLWRIDHPSAASELSAAFDGLRLYVADGHHRYETALGYRDERRAAASTWTGEEPENFALVALTSDDDPGLLVLPIHRVTTAAAPLEAALDRLRGVFQVEAVSNAESLATVLAERGRAISAFGLIAADSPDAYLLTLSGPQSADHLLPQDRSAAWRGLDYSIANYAILRYGLGLDESQMSDYGTMWFTEDADDAIEAVRSGRARYAVLMNPVPVDRILSVADSGERMPQKSTFFYPKVPTGLVFNLLED